MIKPLRPVDIMVKNDKTEYLVRLKGTTYSLTRPVLVELINALAILMDTRRPTNWIPCVFEKPEAAKPQKGLF